ncbi:MAG: DUF2326 domain-containing protein, partial [Alphaproteobacteria bacterium]|nr:DUF2326 domain-containing protein [Alphaproteobacteria bacterium]
RFPPSPTSGHSSRSTVSTDKDTTNGLGKSTLIEIIDFCLGSGARAGSGLCVDALKGWSFTLDVTIGGHRVQVSRSTERHGFIEVSGPTTAWPIQPAINKKFDARGLDVKDWRYVLGWAFFGYFERNRSSDYQPSPRSLISYFIRSQPAAYVDPFKHFGAQKTWDIQLHNAFLIGLDWTKASRWQVLKDQKKAIDALKEAIKTGVIDAQLGTLGELEAERVQLEGEVEREREGLASFKVHPQYREIQERADVLTTRIHELTNASMVDRRRVTRYLESLATERSPEEGKLEELYQEAGVTFPQTIKKTLDEARSFHRQIVENRQHFIASEIDRLKMRLNDSDLELGRLTEERANILSILASRGALEELTALQERHSVTKEELEAIKTRIQQLRQMSAKRDEIKVATVELRKSTEVDYEERRAIWSNALRLFSENSEALYKVPGRLMIDIADTGYQFGVEIPGSPSEGIGKMKIFCYDLILITLLRQRGLGLDFLIHDSTIFDGVDPRQRAHALERAADLSERYGFQYICALNSDMVPTSDFSSGFDYGKHVRLRLTDTDASGSLLGMRF